MHNEKVNVEGSNLGPAVAYISAFGWSDHQIQPTTPAATVHTPMYVVGSKSFRPDIQKPREMENAVRDI